MKVGEKLWAAVYENGEIGGNPETLAMDNHKSSVMFIVDSWRELKNGVKDGSVKIKRVKIIEVENE